MKIQALSCVVLSVGGLLLLAAARASSSGDTQSPAEKASVRTEVLGRSPDWSPGTSWSVRYEIPRTSTEDAAKVALMPTTCTYLVLEETTSAAFPNIAVCVLKLTSDAYPTSFILTFAKSDRILLRVQEQRGEERMEFARNVWGDDSSMFYNGALPDVAVFDAPRFPLQLGLRSVIDRSNLFGASLKMLPVTKDALIRKSAVQVAEAMIADGKLVPVYGPGSDLNQLGFYELTEYDPTDDSLMLTFVSPADPVFERRNETTLTFDGSMWWKKAERRLDGRVVLVGTRLEKK